VARQARAPVISGLVGSGLSSPDAVSDLSSPDAVSDLSSPDAYYILTLPLVRKMKRNAEERENAKRPE